jgi:beta-lactamase class D
VGVAHPALSRRRRRRLKRLLTRALPLVLIAAGAFGAGFWEAGAAGRDARGIARRYVTAWTRREFPEMYRLLTPGSRREIGERAFATAYTAAASTATLVSVRMISVGGFSNGDVSVKMAARTHIFGVIDRPLEVPVDTSSGGVVFSPALLFPGVHAGEQLHRTTYLAARGTLLADDRVPLAEGPNRTSSIPQVASEIVGSLGPIPAAVRAHYLAEGYPPSAQIGLSGLELAFQRRLAGHPGGTLYAGHRVLARVIATAGETVRTTIDPTIEEAAIAALGNSYAGMTVINPRTGAVLALAGIAYALQPPGSTFKIITATAALQSGLATLETEYPVESTADVGGYILQNANKEACGGTLIEAFAVSCDTVFAPLGIQVGAQRLVSTAELYGFNHAAGIRGAPESTLPSAATIGDETAIGSSAIGQGDVLASTLEIADVGATIADGGRRPIPTLLFGARPRFVRVTSGTVANEVEQMMEAVVAYGTGTAAQISGVVVAGKTGTAELANTANQQNNKAETDGWFVGYAPAGVAGHAKVVAAALFPNAGYGAQTAAPAVREAIETALATKY